MKLRKNNLDEQQERKLLEIESRGFWMAFWGLLIALVVQSLVMKNTSMVIGEWIMFMTLALYLALSCSRAGIWDRHMDMNRKTLFYVSIIAALCAAVFMFSFTFLRYHKPISSLYAGVIIGLSTFAICYIALTLAARVTKKRQDELNAEPEEEKNEENGN